MLAMAVSRLDFDALFKWFCFARRKYSFWFKSLAGRGWGRLLLFLVCFEINLGMPSWENVTTELYWHDGNEHLFCSSWVFYQSKSNKVVAGDSTLQNNVYHCRDYRIHWKGIDNMEMLTTHQVNLASSQPIIISSQVKYLIIIIRTWVNNI